jgi:hypothetical protein
MRAAMSLSSKLSARDAKNAQALDALYREIPAFECVDGCTACCGPVPFSEIEAERVGLKQIEGSTDLTCPFVKDGGCSVYEHRPFICRLFGTAPQVPQLHCQNGGTCKKPMSERRAGALLNIYLKLNRR